MYIVDTNKAGAQEMARWAKVSAALAEDRVPFPTPTPHCSQLPETPARDVDTPLLVSMSICTHMNIIPNTHKRNSFFKWQPRKQYTIAYHWVEDLCFAHFHQQGLERLSQATEPPPESVYVLTNSTSQKTSLPSEAMN